jgi:hypothetical protein
VGWLMIIDLILDRKDGRHYSAHDFYLEVRKYECLGVGTHGEDISLAMDYGDNKDVQRVLCQYVQRNGYPANIEDYIRSQVWVV